jgi:hypothetical protein
MSLRLGLILTDEVGEKRQKGASLGLASAVVVSISKASVYPYGAPYSPLL